MSADTTLDRLLDGRVALRQSAGGYRAGMDAVLLAAALDAKPGEHLVEFGCGPGAAMLCAAARLGEARFTGIEKDAAAAELARENIAANGLDPRMQVETADIGSLGNAHRADQVFFNPPFFDDETRLRTPKTEKRDAWLSGPTPLGIWIRAAARTLKARGRLTLIHRADRLGDILHGLEKSFGSVVIKPVHPREGQPAKRVIVLARIGGRAPLQLLSPLWLHDGEGHSAEADAILRGRAVVQMG
ncbi:methyltransferase [Maricaulis sp.]|uniref:tRNA1(Val) (adenine(37)-N6)-methyltransferase n=1 Tax=Maricaulis sp. TaxID=1486257 RepID=UPI00261ECC18|nr:methyltransferase [Maricaulis sp.]